MQQGDISVNVDEIKMKAMLDSVFNEAIDKAVRRIDKPGNTAAPWRDFSSEHLEGRLIKEFREWRESKSDKELLDIINLAAFLYLSKRLR